MRSDVHHNVYEFPASKCLVVYGDINGDVNLLVKNMCPVSDDRHGRYHCWRLQYWIRKRKVLRHHYKNSKRLYKAIVFIRGNHDNYAYFDGRLLHKRL